MSTANCLCGGIKMEITMPLDSINMCHCTQCQKAQGGGYAAIVSVLRANLHILEGENLMHSYASSPNKRRVFCSQCGSPLYSERLDKPEQVRLRIGIINEPLNASIVAHAYTQHKANWDQICDDAPQYTQKSPKSSQ